MDLAEVSKIVNQLDLWLDSMHLPGGYSGPVVHWWDEALIYQGPGLDWRYEGIIIGYLNLWASTGDKRWLRKATRAGDDLVAGQLPSGNFRNSRFELNPGTGGTPHEAACDLGLLRLASALRDDGDEGWEVYKETAFRNLKGFYLGHLWSASGQTFYDDKNLTSFVPNKASTLVEALSDLAQISEDDRWFQVYALPTLERIFQHQVREGEFNGAIYQNSIRGEYVEKFFPLYIARCVPAILEGYKWTGDHRFIGSACQVGEFLAASQYADGSFPQVIYSNSKINRYPQWVAALGDILRVLDLLSPLGVNFDRQAILEYMLAGQRPDGGICTAKGFAKVSPFGFKDDFRDDLSVCGWVDKAFRYLTGLMVPSYLGDSSGTIDARQL